MIKINKKVLLSLIDIYFSHLPTKAQILTSITSGADRDHEIRGVQHNTLIIISMPMISSTMVSNFVNCNQICFFFHASLYLIAEIFFKFANDEESERRH